MKGRNIGWPWIWAVVWGLATWAGAEQKEQTILNTHSFWRCHLTLRAPVSGAVEDAKPNAAFIPRVGRKSAWPDDFSQPWTPEPPAGWEQPDYDDAAWWRETGPFLGLNTVVSGAWVSWSRHGEHQPTAVAMLSLRGKFRVSDPGAIQSLRLSVEYRGGIVVFLNGHEVYRGHMSRPVGTGVAVLAEDYPEAARARMHHDGRDENSAQLLEQRIRKAESVALPVERLRPGVNVLAVAIHRAAQSPARGRGIDWSTCGLNAVELTATGSGSEPNVTRPRGVVQIWNAPLFADVTDVDYGDPNDRLHPIRMAGARAGVFAGQVVVGSDTPIRGLAADVSAFRREGGGPDLPRSAVRIYWPTMTGNASDMNLRYPPRPGVRRPFKEIWAEMRNAEGLSETAPDEVAVAVKTRIEAGYDYVWGAVQPVWVQIEVPRDAKPGLYKGVLILRAQGLPETRIPIEATVHDWALPEPQNFAFFTDFIQSPDGVAAYYEAELWSDRHFALMEETFRLLGQVGNKTVYVPCVLPTHFSNEETMIRWVKKPGGGYDFDFGNLGRYLDMVSGIWAGRA